MSFKLLWECAVCFDAGRELFVEIESFWHNFVKMLGFLTPFHCYVGKNRCDENPPVKLMMSFVGLIIENFTTM